MAWNVKNEMPERQRNGGDGERPDGHYGGEDRRQRVDVGHGEIRVLEHHQGGQVADDRDGEPAAAQPRLRGAADRAAHRPVERHRAHDQRQVSRLAPCVEREACDEQHAVAPRARKREIGRQRQRQEQEQEYRRREDHVGPWRERRRRGLHGVTQLHQDRRVVRRLLALALVAVDAACGAARGQRRRQQDVVDAQAVVLGECKLAIVPPAERRRRLVEQAKAVLEARGEKRAKRGALGVGAQHLPGPQRRVVHVAVFRRDVEVAHHGDVRVAGQDIAQIRRGRRAPVELVAVLVGVDGLPVGDVEIDDAHAGDRRRDDALLVVRKPGNAHGDVGHRKPFAGEDGHAVVGLLPGEMRGVAGGRDVHDRKLVVFELGFLQADDVRLVRGQPRQQARQADIERIDVPGGEDHRAFRTDRSGRRPGRLTSLTSDSRLRGGACPRPACRPGPSAAAVR